MSERTKEERAQREIARRQQQLSRPRSKLYLPYLVLIISLVYITDEIASQIATLMKTEIANDMLSRFGQSSVGALEILSMISVPFLALGIVYKPLSDRFGRKPFLVINTFGMSAGLLIVYLSRSIPMYVVGACVVQFFVPHDMQAVYIMEVAPDKHRAKLHSVVKCAAMLGVMVIPLLRRMLMHSTAQWRRVYLVPAVVGAATAFAALLLAKETDAFNRSRINFLRGNVEANGTAAEGGILPALRFIWKHKQLRWLFIALACSETGYMLTIDYEVIMTYGYAQHFMHSGLFMTLEDAVESVGVHEITTALFLFPVGCALGQLIPGFIADRRSRKTAALVSSLISVALFLGFMLGASWGAPPYPVGFLAGACIGFFWSNLDILLMMAGESSPTALRSSILAASNLAMGLGIGAAYGITLPLLTILGNASAGVVILCTAIPGLAVAFTILALKTHDTRGVNLSAVRGDEWDLPCQESVKEME